MINRYRVPAAMALVLAAAGCAEQPSSPSLMGDPQATGIESSREVEARIRSIIVTGTAGAAAPHVKVFDGSTTAETSAFLAYPVEFTGGVRVAAGDVDGDGLADVVTGAGPGGGPHVKVFSGADGSELASFFAYPVDFAGGVFVAAGDVNGDGLADIVTGAGPGGAAHVKVFSGADQSLLASFFAYPGFTGGVTVAAGDVDGDGRADIVTGAGPGAGPHVKVFSGTDQSALMSFFAYATDFTGGVYVAAGDVTGDGRADVITGAGSGGNTHVKVFSGDGGTTVASFLAYPAVSAAVHVATADVDGDGNADIVTGTGAGAGSHVQVFSGATGAQLASFFAYDPGFTGGVFVGAAQQGAPPVEVDDVTEAAAQAVEAGTLTGTGQGSSANGRLNAWREMLAEAGRLFAAGSTEEGCGQLRQAYLRADGESPPPDFITGDARSDIADLVEAAWQTAGCSGD